MPSTKVTPTERMGVTATICGTIRTEKPITVVKAESNTARPVERVISRTHVR